MIKKNLSENCSDCICATCKFAFKDSGICGSFCEVNCRGKHQFNEKKISKNAFCKKYKTIDDLYLISIPPNKTKSEN